MCKILIVDDNADIRECFAFNLQKAGYHTVEADSGLSGLWEMEKEAPDLILLDLMMPSPDGYELCRYFKNDSSIPVIIISAKGAREEIEEGLSMGAKAYLPKPVSLEKLLITVQQVLNAA
ncbi:response regulator [bacterium]|nr:response regulator [bacterium]